MTVSHVRMAITAVAMGISATASGQTAPAAPVAQRDGADRITLVGCIQREADYRRATGSGTGGVGGFGLGLGDEFVLVGALRAGTAPPPPPAVGSTVNDIAIAASECSATVGGEAFELTGARENELARFVGRRVEITGALKGGTDAPVGTSGTTTRTDTTGLDKLNPWGTDLELQEVEITSFRERQQ